MINTKALLIIVTLVSVAAGVIGFAGLWTPFVWILIPLGMIYGLSLKSGSLDVGLMLVMTLFILGGVQLIESLMALIVVGMFVSPFIDAFVVFFAGLLTSYSLRYLWTTFTK